jgi:SAM-dependent methyltransferase
MRKAAVPHAQVIWQDGTAEDTSLPDGSVDLVLCAQSFHWFRPDEALAELHRILRAGGRVALMWNVRDPSHAPTAAYGALLKRAAHGAPAIRRQDAALQLQRNAGFANFRLLTFLHQQRLTADGVLGRALSASYTPLIGTERVALESGLRQLHADCCDAQGLMTLAYVTEVYLAERP